MVTQLWGGLGNQLFQVGAGLAVARRHGCELVVDPTLLAHDPARSYALDGWDLPFSLEPPPWLHLMTPFSGTIGAGTFGGEESRLDPLPPDRPWWPTAVVLREGGMEHVDLLDRVPVPCVLQGFWQSWRSVWPVLGELRAAVPKVRVSAEVALVAAELRRQGALAIHVRRTDFLGPNSVRYGAVSVDYIETGLSMLRARLGHRPAVVVSDDPAWCRSRLSHLDDLCISEGSRSADEDLVLVAACRGHVIANSTFSWWGAALADSELVVAPDPWWRDPHLVSPDLLPPAWVRLPTELLGE